MFEHLRLTAPNLKEQELLHLSRVNVICGRNNSGKSTVLRAIEAVGRSEDSEFGHTLPAPSTESIRSQVLQDVRWRGSLQKRNPGVGALKQVEERLLAILGEREAWFPNDQVALAERIISSGHELLGGNVGLPAEPIKAAFLRQLSDRGKASSMPRTPPFSLLVDAKRALPSRAHRAKDPQPSGDAIVLELFHWQNQLPDSDLRVRYEKLVRIFQVVTDGYSFQLSEQDATQVELNFCPEGGEHRNATYFGLGLREALEILYHAMHPQSPPVLLLEEPENHLHPDLQRRLLHALYHETDKQYFFATHSHVFLSSTVPERRVYHTRWGKGIEISDDTRRADILNDLGFSVADNLLADLIILVEGIKDIPVLERFLAKMRLLPKYDVKIWPLFGNSMEHFDFALFKERNQMIGLVDKDPESERSRKAFSARAKKAKVEVHQLEGYAIENYFPIEAIKQVYPGKVPKKVTELAPSQSVKDQLKFDVKNRNREIVEHMEIADLKGTDLMEFLEKVKAILEEGEEAPESA